MDKWIKCSEKMPDIGVPVWIDGPIQAGIGARCDQNDGTWLWGFAIYTPYWDATYGAWIIDEYDCDCDEVEVKNWMPLPTPPSTP